MIRAGALKDFVTIERPGDKTASGAASGWAEVAKTYASVEPLSGRELQSARLVYAEVTTRVRMRYMDGLTAKMRVVCEGRRFEVHDLIDTQFRHEELVLMCAEVQ